jgi:GTPase KRas protein
MFGQAPVMLVGNKCDRVTEREVSTQEGQALAKELGCDFVEASAKNCVNVEKAFFDVVRQLRRQRHQASGRSPSDRKDPRVRAYHEKDRARGNGDRRPRGAGMTGGNKRGKDKPKCVIL